MTLIYNLKISSSYETTMFSCRSPFKTTPVNMKMLSKMS